MNSRDERIKFYGAKRMNHHLRSNFLCDIVLCVRTCTNFSEATDFYFGCSRQKVSVSPLFCPRGVFVFFSPLSKKQKKILDAGCWRWALFFHFVEMDDGWIFFVSFSFFSLFTFLFILFMLFFVVRYSSYELKQVRRRRRRRRPRARTHDT